MDDLFTLLIPIFFICLVLSLLRPTIFSRFFREDVNRKKLGLIFGGALFASFVLFGITADTENKEQTKEVTSLEKNEVKGDNEESADDKTKEEEIDNLELPNVDLEKNDGDQIEEIKYKEERIDALSLAQAYKIKKTINEGNLKFEVKSGTKLYDVFRIQKQSGYIDSSGRWVVVKDGGRFVVIYRSNGLGESLNNPQWSIINQEMKALNGTAMKYTPELGYQNPELNKDNFSDSKKLYLRWMKVSDRYKDILDDPNVGYDLYNETENKITEIVAKEFDVSVDLADKMFIEGMQEEVSETRDANKERGDILSDEKLLELLKEQGDLYIPEN